MRDPFITDRSRMAIVANAAVPILVDRLGGSVVVSEAELTALAARYGGRVGVQAEEIEPGSVFRLTLVPLEPSPAPEVPRPSWRGCDTPVLRHPRVNRQVSEGRPQGSTHPLTTSAIAVWRV